MSTLVKSTLVLKYLICGDISWFSLIKHQKNYVVNKKLLCKYIRSPSVVFIPVKSVDGFQSLSLGIKASWWLRVFLSTLPHEDNILLTIYKRFDWENENQKLKANTVINPSIFHCFVILVKGRNLFGTLFQDNDIKDSFTNMPGHF